MSAEQGSKANESTSARRIFNLIILDESGSMYGLEKACVDGVNDIVHTIKNAYKTNPEQKQMFSFISFSGRVFEDFPGNNERTVGFSQE